MSVTFPSRSRSHYLLVKKDLVVLTAAAFSISQPVLFTRHALAAVVNILSQIINPELEIYHI